MYARTELQNQQYLFLYSQEQTVNMIQRKHLKMLEQTLSQRYSERHDPSGGKTRGSIRNTDFRSDRWS